MAGATDSAFYDERSIAIVGLSCRLPGDASTAEGFWELLQNGRSAISSVPQDRWNSRGFDTTTKGQLNTSRTDRAHFLKGDVSTFDANFFSLSQAEATSMDAQQRLMLEVSYEAFENAGMPIEVLSKSKTGCFVGAFTHDWKEMHFSDVDSMPKYAMSGIQPELLSNRVSYFFDLTGPSMTIETACSGSLVGLHVACQSLLAGDCESALVGGANLMLNPNMFLALSNQSFLAPDGLCKAFDASANGYGRGEGFAAVILKPVEKAIRDGDAIRAVIRGTGTNQDGRTKGITMPNGHAQEELIRSTYLSAGLDMKDTEYFEAHGTGTQAGDLEELGAISRTVAGARKAAGLEKLWVGSAKTNVGHLESVAGLVGVVKAALTLEKATIPPNLHFNNPSPKIPFDPWHIRVPVGEKIDWPLASQSSGVRRISVNSFGFGGSNAHAILQDAPTYLSERKRKQLNGHLTNGSHPPEREQEQEQEQEQDLLVPPQLFILSANDQAGLSRQRDALATYLSQIPSSLSPTASSVLLRQLSHTLSTKRTRLPWRTYFTSSLPPSSASTSPGSSNPFTSLSQTLSSSSSSSFPALRASTSSSSSTHQPRLAYIFTGQGAQWPRMGVTLLDSFPVFRASVEAADLYLRTKQDCPWSAVEELRKGDEDEEGSRIHDPLYSQTLCTVLQVALVELLRSFGVPAPKSVVGHSSGEMAAAFACGALSREDAWGVAYWRGKLSAGLASSSDSASSSSSSSSLKKKNKKGAMMAVGASAEEARGWVEGLEKGKCVVACVNSPTSVTVSGDVEGLDELEGLLKQRGVFARKLKVSTAYHSHHMQVVADEYLEALKDLRPLPVEDKAPTTMFTSVSESMVGGHGELGASHWVKNLVSPVLFSGTVRELARPKEGDELDQAAGIAVDMFIEIGPHPALRGPVQQTLQGHGLPSVEYLSLLSRGVDGVETVLNTIGHMVCRGVQVDLEAVNNASADAPSLSADLKRPLTDLPPYAWDHSRSYWSESRLVREFRHRHHAQLSLLGAPAPGFAAGERLWRGYIRPNEQAWVRHHQIQSSSLYPAGGFVAMALEAASQIARSSTDASDARQFRVRDIQISSPIVIMDDAPVEYIVQLRPHSGDKNAWEFSVSSSASSKDALKRNCSGVVAIDYSLPESDLDNSEIQDLSRAVNDACTVVQQVNQFYSQMEKTGFGYGESLQRLKSIHRDSMGRSHCTADIYHVEQNLMKGNEGRPHVIHPTTLEALFQFAYTAFDQAIQKDQRAHVVSKIEEITVNANIPYAGGSLLAGTATATRKGFRELAADVHVMDPATKMPVVFIKTLTCVELAGGDTSAQQDDSQQNGSQVVLNKMVWKTCLDLYSAEEQKSILEEDVVPGFEYTERLSTQLQRSLSAVNAAVKEAQAKRTPNMKLRNIVKWIAQQLQDSTMPFIQTGVREHNTTTNVKSRVFDALTGASPAEDLLHPHANPQDLLATLPGMEITKSKVQRAVELMTHSVPTLSILEIGPGATGLTEPWLMGAQGIPETVSYTYVSADSNNIQKLRERTVSGIRSQLQVLDIEQDLADQNIDLASFDLIVSCNLLSSAVNAETVLANVKKLLTENGKLCLAELTRPSPEALPVLGLVCDWWKRRDDGLRRPLTNPSITECLQAQGLHSYFISPDFNTPDLHQATTILASPLSPLENTPLTLTNAITQQDEEENTIILVPSNPTPSCLSTATALVERLSSSSSSSSRQDKPRTSCSIVHWEPSSSSFPFHTSSRRPTTTKKTHIISLLELSPTAAAPFLPALSEPDFEALKTLITSSSSSSSTSSLTWVTSLPEPHSSTILGFARVVRFEVPGLDFRTLTLSAAAGEEGEEESQVAADKIMRVFKAPRGEDGGGGDNEFREEEEEEGKRRFLQVARVHVDEEMNREVGKVLKERDVDMVELGGGLKRLGIREAGRLDTVCFGGDGEEILEELGDAEVEIEVKAAGLSSRDLSVALGQIADNQFGFEASGIVSRVGRGVLDVRPGDRVCALACGTQQSVLRIKADMCQVIPEDVSFEVAASWLLASSVALHALNKIARAEAGQTILVQGGQSVGQAAIQLGQHLGLEIYVTVSSDEEREQMKSIFGIPEDRVIVLSSCPRFAQAVLRATRDNGVDIVLNSLGGEGLRESWKCMNPFGILIDLANSGESIADMRPPQNDAIFASINVGRILKHKPCLMADALKRTLALLREGILKPNMLSPPMVFPASEIEAAMRSIQQQQQQQQQLGTHNNQGRSSRVVISYSPADKVPTLYSPKQDCLRIDGQKGTYLIAGGLGGIGRNLAQLLVSCGARNLAFLSRSGASTDEQKSFLERLNAMGGVTAKAYKCDISSATSLSSALAYCRDVDNMPPIRGVIHSAVVFRDSVLQNMNFSQWDELMGVKLRGSWNLHEQFATTESNLDFFLCIGSFMAIIGGRGQSNYSAGGAFQDGLAHYRRSLGLPAVTIDLGIVKGFGAVEEQGIAGGHTREWRDPFGIDEDGVHALVKMAISGQMDRGKGGGVPAQMINSIPTGGQVRAANGVEQPYYFDDAKFRVMAALGMRDDNLGAGGGGQQRSVPLKEQLMGVTTTDEASGLVTAALVAKVAKGMQVEADEIDANKALHEYGVDSLVAVDIVSWVRKDVGVEIAVFDVMASKPMTGFVRDVVAKGNWGKN